MAAFNTYMDRLIGADRLKPSMRSQLLFEQVQAISQLTPVMSAGAVAISLLLMAMSLDEAVLPSIVAWSAALYAALFVGMRGWLRVKRSVEDRKPSANAVHAAFLNSAFLGMVWGVLPILLLPSGDRCSPSPPASSWPACFAHRASRC